MRADHAVPVWEAFGPRAVKVIGQDSKFRDIGKVDATPMRQRSGAGGPTDLVDEHLDRARVLTKQMWFGDPLQAVQDEGDEVPFRDGCGNQSLRIHLHAEPRFRRKFTGMASPRLPPLRPRMRYSRVC
jgi:hypothetical protein